MAMRNTDMAMRNTDMAMRNTVGRRRSMGMGMRSMDMGVVHIMSMKRFMATPMVGSHARAIIKPLEAP